MQYYQITRFLSFHGRRCNHYYWSLFRSVCGFSKYLIHLRVTLYLKGCA